MDYTNLFLKLLELSPFVATLFLFLFKVWNSMQGTNKALIDTMKEHSASQLVMQEKSIIAQNNSAESNRMLAGSITDLRFSLVASNDELSKEINDLRYSRLNGNRPATRKPTPAAPTA